MNEALHILETAGIRPTPNRLLVVRELAAADRPLAMTDIEESIATLDKSSVFRVLTLLLEHHLVHAVEDGRGIVKYELCRSHDCNGDDDLHVHFYCTACNRVYCFDHIPVPRVELPAGFRAESVNYMLKGICPQCALLKTSD